MSRYPHVGFHFKVDFPGIGSTDADTRFQEVGGLSAEVAVEDLPVGGENSFDYKLPTKAKHGNLVLKRGFINDSKLIEWLTNAVQHFSFKLCNVTVTLLNENHEPCSTWIFAKAFPVKWAFSDFKAMDNGLVIETIELAYQEFTYKSES